MMVQVRDWQEMGIGRDRDDGKDVTITDVNDVTITDVNDFVINVDLSSSRIWNVLLHFSGLSKFQNMIFSISRKHNVHQLSLLFSCIIWRLISFVINNRPGCDNPKMHFRETIFRGKTKQNKRTHFLCTFNFCRLSAGPIFSPLPPLYKWSLIS